jgi:hypothetical protein
MSSSYLLENKRDNKGQKGQSKKVRMQGAESEWVKRGGTERPSEVGVEESQLMLIYYCYSVKSLYSISF